jgi:hypothetical protein
MTRPEMHHDDDDGDGVKVPMPSPVAEAGGAASGSPRAVVVAATAISSIPAAGNSGVPITQWSVSQDKRALGKRNSTEKEGWVGCGLIRILAAKGWILG